MSKLLNFFLVTLVLVLASCHSADEFDSQPVTKLPLKEVTLSVTNPFMSNDSLTRMTAIELNFAWVDGDKADIAMDGELYNFTYSAEKQGFVGKVPGGTLTSGLTFMYPSGAYTYNGTAFYYDTPSEKNVKSAYTNYFPLVGSYDSNTNVVTTKSLFNYICLGALEEQTDIKVTPNSNDSYLFSCGDYQVGYSCLSSYTYIFSSGFNVYLPVYVNANTYVITSPSQGKTIGSYTTNPGENQIFTISNLKEKTLQVDFPQFSTYEISAN